MALLPSDPAKQKRLLIGVAPLLLLGAYWYFLHGGYTERLTAMADRLDRIEASNANARTLSTRGRQLEERLQVFERHIDRLEDLVPRNEEVSQLLNQISEKATEVGVEVVRFNPGETTTGAHYNRRTFEMAVLGSFHNVVRFLTEVGSLPRIITPTELSVVPNNTPSRDGGEMLQASFLIETYVLPDRPATAQQGANTGA